MAGGCSTTGASGGGAAAPPAGSSSSGAAVTALAAEYWEAQMETHPIEATIRGDRRYDDRVDDVSPAARDRELARLHGLRARVAAVDAAALPPPERLTRVLLLDELDADLARGACRLSEWAVDPRNGPQIEFLRLSDLQPVATVPEGRALVARWQKIGAVVDQHGANLRRGLAAGKVSTRDEVTRVLGQLDALLAQKDGEWALRAPAKKAHPEWPAAEQAAFVAGIDAAIAGSIRPAFARYRDVIRDQILPRARDREHVGLSFIPEGAECYRRLIKVHTSLDLPADQIHGFGLEELARIQDEMKRLGGQVLGTDDAGAIRARLRGDPKLYFSTRDEIEASARAALARANAAMPRFLGRLPRTACEVKRIEDYEEKDSTIAYYQQPALVPGGKGSGTTTPTRPGLYYVNTYQPATRPRFEAEALAFHESVPGHHVQIALAQELTGVPEFRKHAGVTAFVEGWGLYSERLADELGLYSDGYQRLGMLSFDAWRASRLVVDTGLHVMGWSRQQAITFMEQNTALAPANIVNEVDRYVGSPGQALAYKLGQREIFRLRADAQARLGPRFELRRFHDTVLGNGAVSLTVLREQVADWIAAGGP